MFVHGYQWAEAYSKRVFHAQGWPLFSVVMNLSCAILGAGTLGVPYALASTGWSGVCVLIALAWVQTYTGHVLLESMSHFPQCETYHDVGEALWGAPGKYLIIFVQSINNLGTAILYFILSADHLKILFSHLHFSTGVWTLVVFVLIFPLCLLPSMKEFSFASAIGLSASVSTTVVVLYHLDFSNLESVSYPTQSLQSYIHGVATFCFAFCPHTVLPVAVRDLPEPRLHTGNLGLALSMLGCCVCYLLVSVPTYYVYGKNIHEDVLTNLPHSLGWYLAILGITLHVMIAIPIFANESFFILERSAQAVYRAKKKDAECEDIPGGKFCEKLILRSLVLLSMVLFAVLVPYFGDMMSFLGGTAMLASCVFPCLFYLYTFRDLSLTTRVINWLIIISSFVVGMGSSLLAAKAMHDKGSVG